MSEAFRFLHTADLHLGSAFLGLRNSVPQLAETLAAAPFDAFARIVDAAVTEAVDFVVIAGDIFDSAAPTLTARLRFRAELQRLCEAKIPVFATGGNHDPVPAAWSETVRYPENFHLFPAGEPATETVRRNGAELARITGISHAELKESANLADRFPDVSGDVYTIALLHANIGAQPGSRPYAPAPLETLTTRNHIDYWALGHVHGFRVLHELHPVIAYPGCPQGRAVNEPGTRGFLLVSVDAARNTTLEFRPAAALEFNVLTLDALTEFTTFDQLTACLRDGIDAYSGDGPLLLRVILRGASPLNAELRALEESELFETLQQELNRCKRQTLLESVELETRGMYDAVALARSDDLAAEISAAAAELRAEGSLRELLKKLRAGRYGIGDFSDAELDEIRAAAESRLLDGLTGNGGFGK